MRQAQRNGRGRGRNNNNRKNQNPLTRSFESNGPDVKIRGTPSHIAEKYVAMARDALSSGDPVLAENYLQHAEHYNRIIMTHREQQSAQGHDTNGRHRNAGELVDNDAASGEGAETAEASAPRGTEPQPTIHSNDRGGDERRPQRRTPRRERNGDRERPKANAGEGERAAEGEQPAPSGRSGANGRGGRRTRYAQSDDQPEFLKRPVRRPRPEAEDSEEKAPVEKSDAAE